MLSFDQCGEARLPGGRELSDDVQQREVGDAFTVGWAPANKDPCACADVLQRLTDQPGLADARFTQDRHQPARWFLDAAFKRLAKELKLPLTPDEPIPGGR